MGLLDRLLRRRPVERRDMDPFAWFGTLMPSPAGGRMNAIASENLATVTACVNAIASGLACLPAAVYRAEGGGRVEAPMHPVARLLRAPNPRQAWPDFIEWLIAQALLYGNALAAIDYDAAGRPTGLRPLPWQFLSVVTLPGGRIAFDVVAHQAPWGGDGMPRRYLEDEVFWLRDRSDDGILGRSRISRAPDVLTAAAGLQCFSAALWANAATPSGLVEVPTNISPAGLRRMREHVEGVITGTANARRLLFVDKDTKFTPLSVSPEDAEVLASRRFTVEELCRLFNVPPPIVQDYSHNTFTNSAQASLWFATNTLMPWARKIEAEFGRSVFTDPAAYHMEIDLSGLTRGDYATRWTANVAAVEAGILTANEVRAQEGYGPAAQRQAAGGGNAA